ncbi:MAG: hypothetical protein KDA68_05340 [Planctomycetaceae bacterium]|nr:hypothetical protein [Planctomycetaceae bacterium]
MTADIAILSSQSNIESNGESIFFKINITIDVSITDVNHFQTDNFVVRETIWSDIDGWASLKMLGGGEGLGKGIGSFDLFERLGSLAACAALYGMGLVQKGIREC